MKFLDRNLPTFPLDTVKQIALDLYGWQGAFTPLESERDQNFRVQTADATYVLKIANADESDGVVDFQTEALRHLAEQAPDLEVPRVVPTVAGDAYTSVAAADGTAHIVRALSWVEGDLLKYAPPSIAQRKSIGQSLAQLDLGLRGFFHAHARHEMLWDLTQCAQLRPHVGHISDPDARQRVTKILDHVLTVTLPATKSLRHQVIHSDAHQGNVLVKADDPTQFAGILDFGDMVYAPLIMELAIAADLRGVAAEQMLPDLCALVSAYDEVLPLDSAEIDLLYDLVIGRLAVTATIIAWRRSATPDQPAYLHDVEEGIWRTMAELENFGRTAITNALRRACRFPVVTTTSVDQLLDERKDKLGRHLRHFYSTPTHIERGAGVWLYGPDGTRYLDAYNNVPVVGHCHPHVVNAVSRQLATLNTHTRYLYNVIIEYAERLTALLPDDLSVCSFVNSGSEANDIAWRIAQHVTGKQGALVMDGAYHGITDAIKAFSPSAGTTPSKPFVRTIEAPDLYRGRFLKGEADLAQKYAADVDRAMAELDNAGLGTAVFMVDSLFVSNGSPDIPDGYVSAVVEKVRAAGGIFIADEVQSGFGRSGDFFWGHDLHGVSAEMVTMGKPVGNGFPLGVVVTSADTLNSFVSEVGLFSTFGGNPVACAAGLAVLDVIEAEGLQENARVTGQHLRDGIRSLMDRHPLIGDVRGTGLMAGVELVTNRDTKAPAVAETARLIDMMRDAGVLLSNGGKLRNTLKIRPPLAFRQPHADILIDTLDKCLAAL